jgi:hypothetical protein
MSTDRAGGPDTRKRDFVVDVVVAAVIVIVVIGMVLLLWWWGTGHAFDQPFLNVVSWMGAAISLAGVVLAYLIFRRQTRQSKRSTRYRNRVLADLQLLMSGVDSKVTDVVDRLSREVPDADAEAGSDVRDRWRDLMPVPSGEGSVYVSSPSGKQRRLYLPGDVPLAVLGALVGEWAKGDHSGRWNLSALRGAFRAEGRGNHPWYLVFLRPEDEETELWKVTRGPGGTDHAVKVTSSKQF